MVKTSSNIILFFSGKKSSSVYSIVTNTYFLNNEWKQTRTLVVQKNLLQSHMVNSTKCLTDKNWLSFVKHISLKPTLKKHVVRCGPREAN